MRGLDFSIGMDSPFWSAIDDCYKVVMTTRSDLDFVDPHISVEFDGTSSEVKKSYALAMQSYFEHNIMLHSKHMDVFVGIAKYVPYAAIGQMADVVDTWGNFSANDYQMCLGFSYITPFVSPRNIEFPDCNIQVNVSFVQDASNTKLYNAIFKFTDFST
jgi:hypothetical protein